MSRSRISWRPTIAACAAVVRLLGSGALGGATIEHALAGAATGSGSVLAKRGMTPEDLGRLEIVSALEVSPDGRCIVYALEIADTEKNSYRHTLHMMDPGRGDPGRDDSGSVDPARSKTRLITPSSRDCWSPRFSPDGRFLAYLCTVEDKGASGEGKAQIFVARSGSRHARRATRIEEGVEEFSWSPDGKSLVLVREDPPRVREDPARVPSTSEPPHPSGTTRRTRGEDAGPDPIVITRTQIQSDGVGFLGDRRTHLWVVPLRGGDARRITSGPYDDSDPQWSPDGSWIAFVSNRSADPDANDNTDIFAVRPDGGGLRVLAANPGPDTHPRWSHRGDRLAFVGQLRANDYYQTSRLMVASSEGGAPLDLTGSLDTWVSADAYYHGSSPLAPPQWSRDDATIDVTLERRGANYLAAVPSTGGPAREILGGPRLLGLVRLAPEIGADSREGLSFAERLYFTLTDPTHPPEIHTAGADGSAIRRLGHLNDLRLAGLALSSPRKLTARSSDGVEIESWLYPPIGVDAFATAPPDGKTYPLILYIHGGPQGFDGDWFDTDLENQVLPANGYAVLRVNYRGSTSYGEPFCHALWGDWHRREYEDLMASVDEAVRLPWIDRERLGIGGWSFGGIMTVWTVGHTDRFKVGVPERFEVDYLSCFGEDMWFAQFLAELGSPFEKADLYRALSPVTYVPRIKTPLYLIANEKDGNCPLSQAMQLYQRLKLLGVKTELVVYPRESHVMTEPRHLIDRLHRLLGWFGAHLK